MGQMFIIMRLISNPTCQISNKSNKNTLPDTLERLRLISDISNPEWLDLLNMSWLDYHQARLNNVNPSENCIENVARYFGLPVKNVLDGNINFQAFALRHEGDFTKMPEVYSIAAYGRMRTSITALDFVERRAGWRLRLDAIRKLDVAEALLQDPFAAISMRFITDLCEYLHRRQFQKADFYSMGAYSCQLNKKSVVGNLFSGLSNAKEAYEFFFYECMKIFEQNCDYKITQISNHNLCVEYVTNPHVAAESGIRHLGSTHVCQLKIGFIANIPQHLGLPAASISEEACVHRGDEVCRLGIAFFEPKKNQFNRSFLMH